MDLKQSSISQRRVSARSFEIWSVLGSKTRPVSPQRLVGCGFIWPLTASSCNKRGEKTERRDDMEAPCDFKSLMSFECDGPVRLWLFFFKLPPAQFFPAASTTAAWLAPTAEGGRRGQLQQHSHKDGGGAGGRDCGCQAPLTRQV